MKYLANDTDFDDEDNAPLSSKFYNLKFDAPTPTYINVGDEGHRPSKKTRLRKMVLPSKPTASSPQSPRSDKEPISISDFPLKSPFKHVKQRVI